MALQQQVLQQQWLATAAWQLATTTLWHAQCAQQQQYAQAYADAGLAPLGGTPHAAPWAPAALHPAPPPAVAGEGAAVRAADLEAEPAFVRWMLQRLDGAAAELEAAARVRAELPPDAAAGAPVAGAPVAAAAAVPQAVALLEAEDLKLALKMVAGVLLLCQDGNPRRLAALSAAAAVGWAYQARANWAARAAARDALARRQAQDRRAAGGGGNGDGGDGDGGDGSGDGDGAGEAALPALRVRGLLEGGIAPGGGLALDLVYLVAAFACSLVPAWAPQPAADPLEVARRRQLTERRREAAAAAANNDDQGSGEVGGEGVGSNGNESPGEEAGEEWEGEWEGEERGYGGGAYAHGIDPNDAARPLVPPATGGAGGGHLHED